MKIHETDESVEKRVKKPLPKEMQKVKDKYTSYLTLMQVVENQYNKFETSKYTVRTSSELTNSLKIYSEIHNISISKSIASICEKYFKDRVISRSYFRLDKGFTAAIPLDIYELERYIDDEVNCIIEISSDIETRLENQTSLISKNDMNDYIVAEYMIGNNYLDEYDEENDCYHAPSKQSNHLGLFEIYLEHLNESVFLEVTYDKKTPSKARLMTREDAVQKAESIHNKLLAGHIRDLEQTTEIKRYKERVKERESYIKTLEMKIHVLEEEIAQLHNDKDDAVADDKDKSKDPIHPRVKIPPIPYETQKTIHDAMIKISSMQAEYQKMLDSIKTVTQQIPIVETEETKTEKKTESNDE